MDFHLQIALVELRGKMGRQERRVTGCGGEKGRTAADSIPEGWPGKGSRASNNHVKGYSGWQGGLGAGRALCESPCPVCILLGTEQLGGI